MGKYKNGGVPTNCEGDPDALRQINDDHDQ